MTETLEHTAERRAEIIFDTTPCQDREDALLAARAIAESDAQVAMVLVSREPPQSFKTIMKFCADNDIRLTRERHLIKEYHKSLVRAAGKG